MCYKKEVKYKRPEMESLDKFCEAGFEMPSKDGSISKHRCLSGRAWYQWQALGDGLFFSQKKRCLLEICGKKYRKRRGPHKKQKGRLFKQLIGWKDREPIWPPCSRHFNLGCVIGSKDCVIFGKWSIIPALQLVVFACVYVLSCWLSVFIDSWEKQHRGLAQFKIKMLAGLSV